jgi:hypothetical protein
MFIHTKFSFLRISNYAMLLCQGDLFLNKEKYKYIKTNTLISNITNVDNKVRNPLWMAPILSISFN